MKVGRTLLLFACFSLIAPRAECANKGYVILPPAQAKEIPRLCSRDWDVKIDGTWQLTQNDIHLLEEHLKKFNGLRPEDGFQETSPLAYYRQYVAIILNGRRFIFINAFQGKVNLSNWQKQLVNICDGGPSSWGLLYDPATGKFSELHTNGLA